MSLGEFDIIARYFTRRSARSDILLSVGDDAAVLAPSPDHRLVIAMDTIVEGVHFPSGTGAADVGYRALAVNLSDIAAMGAQPSWMTLSLSLPHADETWLSGFASGLFELAERFDIALIGGDTVRGPLVITVQIGGCVEPDRWLTRAGAQPGDGLFVTGVVGEASAGLATIQQSIDGGEAGALLRRRFLRPEPRVEIGRRLRVAASAAMDVSDGLLTDAAKLCAASNCGALIDIDALPVSSAMRVLFDEDTCVRHQLAGGDDYELLFTASSDASASFVRNAEATRIGTITEARGVRCKRGGRAFQIERAGYDHFASGTP